MGVQVRVIVGVAVLAGGLGSMAVAQQKANLPDAQVEANVLRALASAPELSTQNIQTSTVYGVVTLSGSATDDAARTKAENLAARAEGVKKVIDEMSVGVAGAGVQNSTVTGESVSGSNDGRVLQSDGTYAPAQGDQIEAAPAADSAAYGQSQQGTTPEPGFTSPPAPLASGQYPERADGQYPVQNNGQYPPQTGPQYPAQANGQYPPPPNRAYPPRRPMYGNAAEYPPVPGGQEAGRSVTVPGGAMLRIRINQGLSTHHTSPGSTFDGTVLNDVVADGAVAIPRGASVQGTVVQAKDAGTLKGRGELALQLTALTLGGRRYALISDTWKRDGQDKSLHTVNSAIGLGALGALVGAVAGGGEGAAIGAGVGGAAGIASSAASPNGSIVILPEAVLTFHLEQPAAVQTVSEQEMGRLAYFAGPNVGARAVIPRRYPNVYYSPYPPPSPYYYPRY